MEAALESAVVTAAPIAAPATTSAPPVLAPVVPAVSTPSTDIGSGDSGSSIKDVFSSLNWTEVIFGVLGSAALYYTIYYYRYKMAEGKALNTEIQNKIDDIAIKLADIQSASQRDGLIGNTQTGFDGFF